MSRFCRYLEAGDNRCTAEAVDPDAEIILCEKHLARALRVVQERLAERGLTTALQQLSPTRA